MKKLVYLIALLSISCNLTALDKQPNPTASAGGRSASVPGTNDLQPGAPAEPQVSSLKKYKGTIAILAALIVSALTYNLEDVFINTLVQKRTSRAVKALILQNTKVDTADLTAVLYNLTLNSATNTVQLSADQADAIRYDINRNVKMFYHWVRAAAIFGTVYTIINRGLCFSGK